MMDTFFLLTQLIDVLFDSGATYSFISARLVTMLGLTPTRKSLLLFVTLPDGKTVSCKELYEGCPLRMYECEFLADLYKLELTDFWITLEIDWLAKYQAQIDYSK